MSQEHVETSISGLIRRWEEAANPEALCSIALYTVAMLARVHDVPEEVLSALDGLITLHDAKVICLGEQLHAHAVYTVLRYLHGLEELERLLPEVESLRE